jgi:hypothetical protein
MIAGALAATLLEPLGAANFAIHLTGESSRGKTSMLKVAASVFGDPNNAHWVASWNVTQTGAEMRAAALCDLPQCYDEIGGGGSGGDAQTAERMVYALINGGGRTRATRDLTMRETPSWRTIVLSTGERELADESTATGAQIRVVHLPMSGFGTLGAAEVDEIRGDCIAHAGRFGREWIGALLAIDDWEPYRASFQEFIQTMRRKADPADPLQARAAAYFALLAFAESLAANLGLGTHDGATMEDLFVSAGRREQVQGQSARAHDELRQWVLSDPDTFPDLGLNSSGDQDAPAASRSGKPRCGFRKDGAVLVIPAQFRLFCKRNGFSSRAVIREWIALGWALHTAGRLDKTVRLGSSTARFVYVLLPPTDSEVE